jgi:hypothetical protein
MKKITKMIFAFIVVAGVSMNAQTALKQGSVTYSMTMSGNDEAAAMMGESTIIVNFDEKMQATNMNMMGGMMLMKTITPFENLKDSKMTVEVMGMKYEIIDLGEEALKANKGLGDLENAVDVTYDKKDIKEIAGFKCYKAIVKNDDGSSSDFYITESIAPQHSNKEAKVKLAGYPLQVKVTTPQGEMTMAATSFSKELPKDSFTIGEGFTKITMEEFQKQMGGN